MGNPLRSVSQNKRAKGSYTTDVFPDQSYVKDIQQKICENAAAEYAWYVKFERADIAYMTSITKEHHRAKGTKSRTSISDQLSSSLNELQNELEVSDLYDNLKSRKYVLNRAIPKTLVEKIGLDTLMQRLPEQVSLGNW
jgi:glutamate dehydrogenase